MTTHLVTFATDDMSRSAVLCTDSALRHGIKVAHRCYPQSLSDEMQRFCTGKRGYGYWIWKPYLVNRLVGDKAFIQNVREGDILIYSDAGVEFITNVSHIIDRMDQDIFLFGNNWEHAHWCKRDAAEAIWPYERKSQESLIRYGDFFSNFWVRFGKQVQASVIFFRVSDYSRRFVKEWLDWCLFEGGRLIDDSPSRLPNHPEFREHRHDQSILTTLSYREGLRLHWWPAVYNRFVSGGPVFTYEKGEYQDDYPPLFHHHRLRNDQWPKHIPLDPAETRRDIAYHTTD